MATLIKADGTIEFIKPEKNNKKFRAHEIHKLVGGYFEVVSIRPGKYGLVTVAPGETLWCNEDGKRLQLPPNRTATAIVAASGGMPGDVVVGDVVLCSAKEID